MTLGERAMAIAARYVSVGVLELWLMVAIFGLLMRGQPERPRDPVGEAAVGMAVVLAAAVSFLVASLVVWIDLRGKAREEKTDG